MTRRQRIRKAPADWRTRTWGEWTLMVIRGELTSLEIHEEMKARSRAKPDPYAHLREADTEEIE